MVSKDISNGSIKIIKVGFLSDQDSGWMGGVNYFKNLFIAMSKVNNPKLIPYIPKIKDEKVRFLLDYCEVVEFKKGFKYRFKKLIHIFNKKKFDKMKYLKDCSNLDIVSHSQVSINKPSIAWIPDFQHVKLPEMFEQDEIIKRNELFRNLAEKSKLVILSSNNALDDFKAFSPKLAHKGRVLNFVAIPNQNVYKKTDQIKSEIIAKYNLPEKYFYVPNQFWKHKNHKVVFEAINILKKQDICIQVVFTGNTNDYRDSDHFNQLMNFAKETGIENNIKLLGLVDLIEVFYLMRNCISIVNPSFFEGWSSTVEEAKSLGKNIILSNINVHREQNPPEGIYFDPENADELASILKTKWNNQTSGPDFNLEHIAKEKLDNRIIAFGKAYQEIVVEALKQ